VNSPVHYHLTDLGVARLLHLVPPPRLSLLVVTNADNSYSPRFLTVTERFMQEGEYDIALVDMVHREHVGEGG
jgi:hypothetical protein